MAKPNYAYEKRQRELEKKKKKAEKSNRKTTTGPDGVEVPVDDTAAEPGAEGVSPAAGAEPVSP